MTPSQKKNLQRLLAPRHIAFIGGNEALYASRQCAAGGFSGQIWGVNPKRRKLDEHPCFASVDDLPEAPDAAFVAVPGSVVPTVVSQLHQRGAGGVVCYSAGFGELGGDGEALEQKLIEVSGDLALVGPNVFGLLNYIQGAHLWPYSHGGQRVTRGPAIISQSGMLSGYLLTNRRSVNFSYVIGAGNQSVLGVEDYLEALLTRSEVTAFGIYLESLRDIPQFAKAALNALDRNIPLVVLKVGRSDLAARTTLTHTGSLAGSDTLYQALFDRLGVVRVPTPSLMLETLNLLTIAGAPTGQRLAAFTCSGGDVAMLADRGEECGIDFKAPSPAASQTLKSLLPAIATVSNPLDYTTPLWGHEEKLKPVFSALVEDDYDAALLVQDYPPPHLKEDRHLYQADARAFMRATREAGIPGAVCSSLPENLDTQIQQFLKDHDTAPLQGIGESVQAIAAATVFGRQRKKHLTQARSISFAIAGRTANSITLDEWQGKKLLENAGIPIPAGELVTVDGVSAAADRLGYPVALKLVSADLPHKTEAGAVRLNLESATQVSDAAKAIQRAVQDYSADLSQECFLVEKMVANSIAELLVGIHNDGQFGHTLTLASGGALVELVADSVTILLPTPREDITTALHSLQVAKLLRGFRNRPAADVDRLVDTICTIVAFARQLGAKLDELDINPLIVHPDGCTAADVLLCVDPEAL
ncbi:MAG: acetate--CoA ligase family protein [Arenicellales bacterium]|nr:acetate--CoA ligase family protein [Arenicellales bacterium]